jgi:hypothetical protein
MSPENEDRIRVRTIFITAPQHVHRIGARSLIQSDARPGLNFNTTCSKAINRLQLECKKPKLRARLKPFGSTCCRISHRNCAPGTVRRAITERHLAVVAGDDILLPDYTPVKIAPQIDERLLTRADGLAIHYPHLRITAGKRQSSSFARNTLASAVSLNR